MIVTLPFVVSVDIQPNPAEINAPVLFSAVVEERQMELKEEQRYSGTFYAGEV